MPPKVVTSARLVELAVNGRLENNEKLRLSTREISEIRKRSREEYMAQRAKNPGCANDKLIERGLN